MTSRRATTAARRRAGPLLALVLVAVSSVVMASAGASSPQPSAGSAEAADRAPAAAPAQGAPAAQTAQPAQPVSVPAAAAPAQAVSRFVPVPPPPPPPPEADTKASAPSGPAANAQAPAATPAGEACDVGAAAGHAQVLVVRSAGTRATVRACSAAENGSYVTDLGPFAGYVGSSGVKSASAKREGDGATPAGVYALRGGFGLRANPGLPQGWFRVDSADVWVDDPASSLYNTHQRGTADGRWTSAEPLANAPAYNYAQVIGYNEAARPGAGSAIFLHVSTGGPTAGCVSLPTSALLDVMRWERPGAVIMIS